MSIFTSLIDICFFSFHVGLNGVSINSCDHIRITTKILMYYGGPQITLTYPSKIANITF